jgi:hypothetical protein
MRPDKGADTAALDAFRAGKTNSCTYTATDPASAVKTITVTLSRP